MSKAFVSFVKKLLVFSFNNPKMQQTLFVVVLLIAAASAALPRVPDNEARQSRMLLNPLGPEERRVFFRNSDECHRVFDNWNLAPLDDGDSYCWFTQYCNIDSANTGYNGLPFLHVSYPAGMGRCRIDTATQGHKLGWVGVRQSGFTYTMIGAQGNCLSTNADGNYFPSNFWDGVDCQDGNHCTNCDTLDAIYALQFQFPPF